MQIQVDRKLDDSRKNDYDQARYLMNGRIEEKRMINRLRGRYLGHAGCLVGMTLGLTIGIILAGVMAVAYNVALNIDAFTWLGLTVILGAIGWIIGHRLTPRFPALESDEQEES